MNKIAEEYHFKKYYEEFVKRHRVILKPSYNYKVKAYVSEKQGSLIFLEFVKGPCSFTYKRIKESIGTILEKIPQHAYTGNLSNTIFSGKNIIREENKLIIIKGDNSPSAWSKEEAKKDAEQEIKDIIKMINSSSKKGVSIASFA